MARAILTPPRKLPEAAAVSSHRPSPEYPAPAALARVSRWRGLLVLDPPFALVMKRKDAPQPYFVAWFANADLLGGE